MSSLESIVDQDNPVRLIDAFVDQLDLVNLYFLVRELKKEDRLARKLREVNMAQRSTRISSGAPLNKRCTASVRKSTSTYSEPSNGSGDILTPTCAN